MDILRNRKGKLVPLSFGGNVRNVCEQVFGCRFKDLSPEQKKLFGQYNRRASYYMNHEVNKTRNRNHKKDLKEKLIEALQLESKCSICNYDRCVAALDFHHPDPSVKENNRLTNCSFETALEEVKKCVLICSNCHREAHYTHRTIVQNRGRKRAHDPLFERFLAAYVAQARDKFDPANLPEWAQAAKPLVQTDCFDD